MESQRAQANPKGKIRQNARHQSQNSAKHTPYTKKNPKANTNNNNNNNNKKKKELRLNTTSQTPFYLTEKWKPAFQISQDPRQ